MTRITIHALFAGIATLSLVVGQAQAGTIVNSSITKDTTLYYHDAEVVQHGNFGGYVTNDADGQHFVVGFDNREGSTHDNARPILKAGDIVSDLNFNGVFSSSEINSAELHLFRVQPEVHDRTGRTYRVTTGGWVEGDLAFDGWGFEDDAASWISIVHDEVPWNTPGGDYDATELGSFSTMIDDPTHMEYTVPVTGAVKHWVDNPSENFGVIVVQDVYQGDSTGFFASRDNWEYVPFIRVQIGPPDPPATEFTWNTTNVGDWAEAGNWTFSTGGNPDTRANSAEHTAIFGDAISGPTTVSTQAAVTVNRIEFNNSTDSFAVAGLGSVNMAATEAPCLSCPSVSATGTHQFQAVVNLLADTTMNVASDSTLSFNNALNLTGNTLTKTGDGTVAINNQLTTAGGNVDVQQGTISGNGTIGGDVTNSGGTTSPGNSPGTLTVDGNYNQGSSGTLAIEIGGTQAGAEYDVLQVLGDASLAGTLSVSLIDGFTPGGGNTFKVLTAGGELTDAGLTLGGSDAASFTMSIDTTNDWIMLMTAGGGGGLTGDYNSNGIVDAADYTLWRESLGTNNPLQNDNIGGVVTEAHYLQWKNNFGNTTGSGSGAAVPEPVSACLLIVAWGGLSLVSRRREGVMS